MQKYAFTMAEVLITLGIIGVVAAMTLPSLINNHRNKALETGLRKAYSVIEQALNMYYVENGERLKDDGTWANQQVPETLKKYFNVIRDCGYAYTSDGVEDTKGCVSNTSSSREDGGDVYKTFNGNTSGQIPRFLDDGQFILTDGMIVFFENGSASSDSLYISVDVNGYLKNPNRLGQDLFMFQIDDKGNLLPMGAEGTDYYSETDEYCSASSTSNMNGAGCTYKALSEKDFFSKLH